MTSLLFAQALAEYGGTTGFSTSVRQAWDRVLFLLGDLEPATWAIIAGVLLALVLLLRRSSTR